MDAVSAGNALNDFTPGSDETLRPLQRARTLFFNHRGVMLPGRQFLPTWTIIRITTAVDTSDRSIFGRHVYNRYL